MVDVNGFSATSSSAEEIWAMKEAGLFACLVVIPSALNSVRVFVELLPVTVDKLKMRLLDSAIMFPVNMMGCKEKHAFLALQLSTNLAWVCCLCFWFQELWSSHL